MLFYPPPSNPYNHVYNGSDSEKELFHKINDVNVDNIEIELSNKSFEELSNVDLFGITSEFNFDSRSVFDDEHILHDFTSC